MRTHTVSGGAGTQIHVAETGPVNARPILLIHGYTQSRLSWRKQFESKLASEFRLVAPDNRGHGNSEKPRDAYESELWADDVHAIIDELDLENPVGVGWSYGGLVLSDYLATYGDDALAGVNFVGAISEKATEDAAHFAGERFIDLSEGLESRDAEESIEALESFLRICVYDDLPPDDLYFMLGFNAIVPPYVREALQARAVQHTDTLRDLSVPVLLTHGEEDQVVLPGAARKHADVIPNTETSFYPDVGHSPFWEATKRFNRELREFVADC